MPKRTTLERKLDQELGKAIVIEKDFKKAEKFISEGACVKVSDYQELDYKELTVNERLHLFGLKSADLASQFYAVHLSEGTEEMSEYLKKVSTHFTGSSILHYAVKYCNPASAAFLITQGADPHEKSQIEPCLSSYEYAQKLGRYDILKEFAAFPVNSGAAAADYSFPLLGDSSIPGGPFVPPDDYLQFLM